MQYTKYYYVFKAILPCSSGTENKETQCEMWPLVADSIKAKPCLDINPCHFHLFECGIASNK